MFYKVSSPGSIMLLGEHAVLRGCSAAVCAINRRIYVTLTPRDDNKIIISSDIGECFTTIKTLAVQHPFDFVLSAIDYFRDRLPSGFNLEIKSEFSDKIGLGSSAAIVVATLSVIKKWIDGVIEQKNIFDIGFEVVRKVQGGVGSGSDVAASVYGGVLSYKMPVIDINTDKNIENINNIEQISFDIPIELIFSGSKMPTPQVIKIVKNREEQNPDVYRVLFACICKCTEIGIVAIKHSNWDMLGKVFTIHQALQNSIGTSNEILEDIVKKVIKITSVYGVKISGSGLGDCVVALGSIPDKYFPMDLEQKNYGIRQIKVCVDKKGVIDEAN